MRILIADDSDIVRSGIVSLLSAEMNLNVCGEARNGLEALQKAQELQPDLTGGDGCLDKSRLAADLVVTIEGMQ
jgi:DNA-binding NarL/FixJ family response regulator